MVEPKIYPPPKPSTPRLAPWDHVDDLCNKLDSLIAIMGAWVPTAPGTTTTPVGWPALDELCNRLDRLITVMETWVPTTPGTTTPTEWPGIDELCNKLDRLITVMESWVPTSPEWPGWDPVINKLDEIKVLLGPFALTAPWVAKAPEEIFRKSIRAVGILNSDKMVNWTKGKRLLLRVDSSLNQAVEIQAVGNIGNTVNGAVDIGTAYTCDAGGRISIGLAWDDWQPYIGCKITIATAPTTGILIIAAVIQE